MPMVVMYITVNKKIPKKKKGAPRSNIIFQQKKRKVLHNFFHEE